MKRIQILLFSTVLIFVMTAFGKNNTSAGRAVDLKASDGAILKQPTSLHQDQDRACCYFIKVIGHERNGATWPGNSRRRESTR